MTLGQERNDMNAELRCFSVCVLLLALIGCGSENGQSEQIQNNPPEEAESKSWEPLESKPAESLRNHN